jgi:acetoin utilization deacetylase AcuC-like enzyme
MGKIFISLEYLSVVMSSELIVYWDESFVEHETPGGGWILPKTDLHEVSEPPSERPERVVNIKNAIETGLSEWTTWHTVEPATWDQVEMVHTSEFVDDMRTLFCEEGGGRVLHDGEAGLTGGNESTCEALQKATGASIQTAERALQSGVTKVPFAPVRPPGHHAMTDEADGFCIFNNIAIAAEHTIQEGLADKVAIIDWDVHHGNGTQEIFYNRDDVLVINLHYLHGRLGPWHPQTGRRDEKGEGDGEGYSVNVPLPHGTGNVGYADTFEAIVEPIIAEFAPDLILASNGLDPGRYDPIGRNVVTKPGFEEIGRRTRYLADEYADSSLGLILEGGYLVSHLPFAILGVLEGSLDIDTGIEDPYDFEETHSENIALVKEWVHKAQQAQSSYWSVTELGKEL